MCWPVLAVGATPRRIRRLGLQFITAHGELAGDLAFLGVGRGAVQLQGRLRELRCRRGHHQGSQPWVEVDGQRRSRRALPQQCCPSWVGGAGSRRSEEHRMRREAMRREGGGGSSSVGVLGSFEIEQQLALLPRPCAPVQDFHRRCRQGPSNDVLHLHGLQDQHGVVLLHGVTLFTSTFSTRRARRLSSRTTAPGALSSPSLRGNCAVSTSSSFTVSRWKRRRAAGLRLPRPLRYQRLRTNAP